MGIKILDWKVLIPVLLLTLPVLLFYLSGSTHRRYQRLVKNYYLQMSPGRRELIESEDLEDLPGPVRKYLEYAGVVGTQKVSSFSVSIDGDFKMSPERDWAPVHVEQMSFTENPVRLFFMKMRFKGLNIIGLHHYESATATMVIRILDIFKAADAAGAEMNRGETVTVFNDMCILAPSTLIDSRIRWKEIDGKTVEGVFTNGNISVKATLFFNEAGQLVNFISDDRYYWNEDNTYERIPWSTPVSQYRQINGLNLAGYGEAVWMKKEGPFPYARFNINDVIINPELSIPGE